MNEVKGVCGVTPHTPLSNTTHQHEANKMANKNPKTVDPAVKHQMLDIEIEIDAGITARIDEAKADYATAIIEYKERRAARIAEIRAERKVLVKDAFNTLMEA